MSQQVSDGLSVKIFQIFIVPSRWITSDSGDPPTFHLNSWLVASCSYLPYTANWLHAGNDYDPSWKYQGEKKHITVYSFIKPSYISRIVQSSGTLTPQTVNITVGHVTYNKKTPTFTFICQSILINCVKPTNVCRFFSLCDELQEITLFPLVMHPWGKHLNRE